tara:strand:- start:742 stop:885 length:144 start_codon:yes stop_codon:yes gene_type:complete
VTQAQHIAHLVDKMLQLSVVDRVGPETVVVEEDLLEFLLVIIPLVLS